MFLKLKSQRGASILMALLFLLVCMLVASSVLMAASANSGKLRSNQQEQQKYLALSSALRLVCAEICAAEYTGQYNYSFQRIYDGEGNDTGRRSHTYTLQRGLLEYRLSEGAGLGDLLPLGRDLDAWLKERFSLPVSETNPADTYNYNTSAVTNSFGGEYRLLLETNLEGVDKVEVLVRLRADGVIRLTAALGDGAAGDYVYKMEAELKPQQNLYELLKLSQTPAVGQNETGKVTWELSWIAKKEAAGT